MNLVRTDLYFADEVFLCGTAAEVTPVASVDDHETGGRGPITKQIQDIFFATVGGRDERFADLLEYPVGQPCSPWSPPARSRWRGPTSTSARRSSCWTCCARTASACGPVAPAFEQAFADRVGTGFAVACSSGTAGPAHGAAPARASARATR